MLCVFAVHDACVSVNRLCMSLSLYQLGEQRATRLACGCARM